MENGFLKRVLDFKLIYDSLAEPRCGKVRLQTLVSHWPSHLSAVGNLPRDCEKFWRLSVTPEGFVDWDGFSGGLEKALKADEERIRKKGTSTSHRPVQSPGSSVALVTSGEIERFLSMCQADSLVRALAKAGRDVHRWQVSIHKQNSASRVTETKRATSELRPTTEAKKSNKEKRCSSLSTAREREELVRGAEVLDNTRQWFQSRLAVLSLEDQQRRAGREQLCAEDLLVELEGDSQLLYHLKQINKHLSSLALTAESNPPQPPPEQNRPNSAQPSAVVEYPSHRVRPRQLRSSADHGLGLRDQRMLRSTSLPAERALTLDRPWPASRKTHRSVSFTGKSHGAMHMLGHPVRAASSTSQLVQQCTDYPGHRSQPSPLPQRPIRHSSSVHSLPGHYHLPPPQSAPPPLLSYPPSRAHSTQSLTRDHHQVVSEVL